MTVGYATTSSTASPPFLGGRNGANPPATAGFLFVGALPRCGCMWAAFLLESSAWSIFSGQVEELPPRKSIQETQRETRKIMQARNRKDTSTTGETKLNPKESSGSGHSEMMWPQDESKNF